MRDWRKILAVSLKAILPFVVLVGSYLLAEHLVATRPEPVQQEAAKTVPAVQAVRAQRRSICFPIRSQGTVQPRRESVLAARVPGRVEWIADCFDESGFFEEGQLLVRVERRDYTLRIQRIEAALRSAIAHQTETTQELNRLLPLLDREATTQAAVQQAQAQAEMAAAAVSEMEAQLAEAQNAEADTEIRAAFDGCIREKCVEVGQFVTVGTTLGSCFATDAVEVRLPVSDDEFAYLQLPLGKSFSAETGRSVRLNVDFAGRQCSWHGTIVRTEAIVDAQTRMVYLVARVDHPYDRTDDNGGQPLAVGMFVEATVSCPPTPDVVLLPESCVNFRNELFLIDDDDRLQVVCVDVLHRERNWIVVRGELPEDSIVCSTRLEGAVPGMTVQVVGDTKAMIAEEASAGVVDLSAVLSAANAKL